MEYLLHGGGVKIFYGSTDVNVNIPYMDGLGIAKWSYFLRWFP